MKLYKTKGQAAMICGLAALLCYTTAMRVARGAAVDEGKNFDPGADSTSKSGNDFDKDKSFQLRDKWSYWAAQHKELLMKLRQASPDDQTIPRQVWDAIPSRPSATSTGIDGSDLELGVVPKDQPSGTAGTGWIWEAAIKTFEKTNNGKKQVPSATVTKYIETKLSSDFKEHHDVALVVQLASKGGLTTTVWASGKVTREVSGEPNKNGVADQANAKDSQEILPSYGFLEFNRSPHLLDESARKARIAEATVLRAKWQDWAARHKGLLKAMLRDEPDKLSAYKNVWDVLPTLPDEAISTDLHANDADKAGITSHDLSASGNGWSWSPTAKLTKFAPNLQGAELDQVKQSWHEAQLKAATTREQDFDESSDIQIASSMNVGAVISLWASGRVTEENIVEPGISGKPTFINTAPLEILPPYSFLQ